MIAAVDQPDAQATDMALHRIEFARDTLRSTQQLIALLDQKSYLVLVITGVTSAAFFSVVGGFLGRLEVLLSPGLVVPLMAAWFLIEAGLVLWFSLKSIQAVVAAAVTIEAPDMVFPHALLRRYGNSAERYYEQLRSLDVDHLLRDYAAEIVKTASIYVEKSREVHDAVKALYRSMIPWLIGILATIVLRVL